MDKQKFNKDVTELTLWLKEHDLNYDAGIKLFMFMIISALSDDKINAEQNRGKFLETFNKIWDRYRDESKTNG